MEQIKYEIIKNLVDNNGNKQRAAIKLGITIRQVNRLIQIYKTKYYNSNYKHFQKLLIICCNVQKSIM